MRSVSLSPMCRVLTFPPLLLSCFPSPVERVVFGAELRHICGRQIHRHRFRRQESHSLRSHLLNISRWGEGKEKTGSFASYTLKSFICSQKKRKELASLSCLIGWGRTERLRMCDTSSLCERADQSGRLQPAAEEEELFECTCCWTPLFKGLHSFKMDENLGDERRQRWGSFTADP